VHIIHMTMYGATVDPTTPLLLEERCETIED